MATGLASDLAVFLKDEKDGLVAQLEQMAARAESDNKRLTKGDLTPHCQQALLTVSYSSS